MPAAAVIPAVATVATGAYMANKASKAQKEAAQTQEEIAREQMEAQERITEPQVAYMRTMLPYYETVGKELQPIISERLARTTLSPAVAQALREKFAEAATDLGTYFAGRGMLESGPAARAMERLETAEAETGVRALEEQTAAAIREGLTYSQTRPQMAGVGYPVAPAVPAFNAEALGSILANVPDITQLATLLKRPTPTAATSLSTAPYYPGVESLGSISAGL